MLNPKKYRKKPVAIEAEQYNGDPSNARLFCPEAFAHNGQLIIPTLEGEHVASIGDYIIRGVKGEFYPCKPDVFEMTYEPVEAGKGEAE